MLTIKKFLFVLAFAVISVSFLPTQLFAQTASYEESECYVGTVPYYDARFKADPDTYDVFVKMGKRGQSAKTDLYIENNDITSCRTIGSVQANGDTWQKIGSWQATGDEPSRFQLSSPAFDSLPDANRPSVMLVSQTNPVCKPEATNCALTFEGSEAYINPRGTLLNEETLYVAQVKDPASDTLLRVDYYSDGKLLYTKPTLEPFDQRYLLGGQQTLSRVLQYESKQQVVIEEEKYVSFAYDIKNLLFRTATSNKAGLQIIGILAMLSIIALVFLGLIHALHRRHMWKLDHGFIKQKPASAKKSPDVVHMLHIDSNFMSKSKWAVPIVVVIAVSLFLVAAIDAYVMQLFRVDGVSMETTLQTDDRLLVNKIPKTWATLNNQEFVPKRGEVIVFHKAKSEAFEELIGEASEETYVVKRVLGLPGERVTVTNGVVTIYNKEYPEGFNPDKDSEWQDTLQLGADENLDLTLTQGEIFVSGDNRPESLDSRSNGPIQLSEIVGRANARVLPISKYTTL